MHTLILSLRKRRMDFSVSFLTSQISPAKPWWRDPPRASQLLISIISLQRKIDQVAPVLFQKPWLTFIQRSNCTLFSPICYPRTTEIPTTFKGLNVKPDFAAGIAAGTRRITKKDRGYMKSHEWFGRRNTSSVGNFRRTVISLLLISEVGL